MQLSRGRIVFHVSEHHGDGSPGVHVRIEVLGVLDYHGELIAKAYKNNRPGIERPEWGGTEFTVVDPVNNRITFAEAGIETALDRWRWRGSGGPGSTGYASRLAR